MRGKMFVPKSRILSDEIELFFGCISKAALVFREGVKDFIHGNQSADCDRCEQISRYERDADSYLSSIRHNLCEFQLIPDSSTDMLELFDDIDDLVDTAKRTLVQLYIEKPDMIRLHSDDIMEMADASVLAVDEMIRAVRTFFSDVRKLEHYVEQVYLYEKQVDRLEEKLKRSIFASKEFGLARKIQGRYFVEKIALLSDEAEEVAKNLLVYKIKRNI